jgi:hypothetical protein
MQVLFESRATDGAQWHELAVRRLRFVTRRLSWIVPRARVRLSDVNGPRGGVDKQVHIELSTDGMGTVVVQAVGKDWRSTLDLALRKANKVLLRSLGRAQQGLRTPLQSTAAEDVLTAQAT